jgi:hypothetical protein
LENQACTNEKEKQTLSPNHNLLVTRHHLLKQTGILSAVAAAAPLSLSATPLREPGMQPHPISSGTATDNLYTSIGVRPILNARGTFTIISGSQSLPEVKQAMFDASHYYVQAAVGRKLRCTWELPAPSSRPAAKPPLLPRPLHVSAAQIPSAHRRCLTKTRQQVIISKYSRNHYDFGVRMSGPEIVEVETEEEFRSKIGEHTAMIYLSGPRAFKEPLSIKTVCAIAKEKNVPVFVDAAAEEPIVPNIHLAAGANSLAQHQRKG